MIFSYSIKRDLAWPMRPKAENNFLIKFLKNNCDYIGTLAAPLALLVLNSGPGSLTAT